MKSKKVTIGIIPDYKVGSKEGYSVKPYYALRCNYAQMISKQKAAPVILAYDYQAIDHYLDLLDGLMVVGGYFDIDPKRYGDKKIHPTVKLNPTREDFEYQMVDKALKTNIPIFGICNGMQLINVLHGGKIIQHIPDNKNFINHEQSHSPKYNDYSTAYHQVQIEPDSKLYQIVKCKSVNTNSSHHQAVKTVGKQIKVAACAIDGVIEAIEKVDHPFCIGVQWHPEFNSNIADQKIFNAFIKAAKNYKK